MKTLIFTAFLLAFSISAHAESAFCAWLGEAAISVAQNRDHGIGGYDLIGTYLQEDKSYGEQSVVIPLIDRVYGIEGNMDPDEVAFAEQQRCEIASVQNINR